MQQKTKPSLLVHGLLLTAIPGTFFVHADDTILSTIKVSFIISLLKIYDRDATLLAKRQYGQDQADRSSALSIAELLLLDHPGRTPLRIRSYHFCHASRWLTRAEEQSLLL